MALFTREDLASYEKGVQQNSATPASAEPPAVETPPPAEVTAQEPVVESSTTTETDPADTGGDGSTVVTSESTSEADPEGSDPEHAAAAPRGGSKSVPYDRFQEVVDERNALRSFGKHLQEQITALAGRLPPSSEAAPPAAPAPAAPVADADPIPTLEQHEFDPQAHAKALAEWTQRQIKKGVAAELQRTTSESSAQQIRAAYEARVDEFRKTAKDYDVIVSNPALPRFSESTAKALVTSENGPALVYHLGKNPDIAARLARSTPEQQLVMLGRIEAQITTPPPAPKPNPAPTPRRTVTNAPPPPRPIPAGSATATKNVMDNSMSMDEWVAHERQKKIAERKVRQDMRARMR